MVYKRFTLSSGYAMGQTGEWNMLLWHTIAAAQGEVFSCELTHLIA